MTDPRRLAAEKRRNVILEILKERGPCLSNFICSRLRTRLGKSYSFESQSVDADLRKLEKAGLVTIETTTGLTTTGLSMGIGNKRGQKFLNVKLVKGKKK